MSRSEIIRFLILRSIGNFLVLFAIFGVLATFGPALYFEVQYRIAQVRGVKYQVVDASQQTLLGTTMDKRGISHGTVQPGFASVLTGPKEQMLIPRDTDFDILIAKIAANAKIFANVDPSNENEFLPILQKGVAHAKGSVFPGIKGNIYLFAHSTDNFWDVGRYNAVFYLLKDLTLGDQIVIFFENRRYDYKVVETKTVDPTDVSYLVGSQQAAQEQLILQTCWPPGTTWKRLLVIARPVSQLSRH